jgi:hypothetical protein
MSHRLVEPGVLLVIYESAEDMRPDRQQPLFREIEEQLASGPVAIVFFVRRVSVVDPSVPAAWAEVVKQRAPRLCAMAVASTSMAVRAAARAFSVGTTLRRIEIDVQAFQSEDEALAWARARREAACGR